MTVGPRGPLLVQDVVFTDEMAHFDRERIPERVVHAKGAGENILLIKGSLHNILVIFISQNVERPLIEVPNFHSCWEKEKKVTNRGLSNEMVTFLWKIEYYI